MADDGPGVLPFVRGIDLSRNDFYVSIASLIILFYYSLSIMFKNLKGVTHVGTFCVPMLAR